MLHIDAGASGEVSRYTSSSITVAPPVAAASSSASARCRGRHLPVGFAYVGTRYKNAFAPAAVVACRTSSELVRIRTIGIAGEPDHSQPVVGEDPQGDEIGRLLDEHDVARRGEQRQHQIEPARAPAVINTACGDTSASTSVR